MDYNAEITRRENANITGRNEQIFINIVHTTWRIFVHRKTDVLEYYNIYIGSYWYINKRIINVGIFIIWETVCAGPKSKYLYFRTIRT